MTTLHPCATLGRSSKPPARPRLTQGERGAGAPRRQIWEPKYPKVSKIMNFQSVLFTMKIELDTDWVCMISHESAPTSQWSRKDAEWSHARPGKSTVSADHVQIALGPSSKVQRLPVVIWPEGQNIKTLFIYYKKTKLYKYLHVIK